MGKSLLSNTLPIPSESTLPNSERVFPYYFVGDSAFPLKTNIMRPFPGKLLSQKKEIFNYRLCRARRIIENTFGILVARWRILLTTINAFPENATHIVLATIVLHNYIKQNAIATDMYCPPKYMDWEDDDGNVHPGEWRNEVPPSTSQRLRMGSNNATRDAFHLRDILADYFLSEGAVPFQYNRT